MSTSLLDYPASLVLLVINLGVSLLAFSNVKVFDYLALAPHRMIAQREYHQIVTSGFVHSNLMHLALNMLTLYFFGPGLELTVLGATGGRGAFLFIYAFSLIVGNLYPFFKYKGQPNYAAVGASGAISGIVFAYCLAHPTTTFYLFFSLPMPAWLFAILYVAYSVYAMRKVEDNIGHEAHLAGAVGGIVATFIAAPEIIVFL
jgi:membrane associated rhomboid family serine protease